VRGLPAVGSTVAGKYEIRRVLGRGGQGIVVEAVNLGLGKRVALKFLDADLAGDAVAVDRFSREARNACKLRSPHAAIVFDVDRTQEGVPFIVQELLEGRTLADMVRDNGPLAIDRGVDCVRQVCAAISEAHDLGILHRDIKASNVFLAEEGPTWTAKVLDFGVSKDLSAETTSNLVVGSPRYISPEQLSNPGTVDARTDIWSIGVLLFFAITGHFPFEQAKVDDIVLAILYGTPQSPRAFREEIPAALEVEIMRALKRNPLERQATVRELSAQLAPFGTAHASVRPPPVLRTNVAPMATSIFGRDADIERIERAITDGRHLVTLLGPAGAGKTRLARRIAELHATAHAGGVWFCDLTEARDLQGVLAAVGHAVEVPLAKAATEEQAIDELARTIAARGSTLLVMDNCEQVIEASARVVAKIAALAKDAIVIATSREALRVAGEQTHVVAPLAIESDAVRLFVDRARNVRPDFSPTDDDATALIDIVRALDGLPLAIELAAARIGVLSVSSIRARLKERFALLAGGPRFASERQRTMRGAIDWSWDLLAPAERTALARCAVFRGGFGLEAAEHIVDAGALDVLQSLCEKSLVVSDEPPELGERRYRLFESVRAYAHERLDEMSLEAATLDRHAEYYAHAGAAWTKASAAGDASARRLVAFELENLRAAHRHSLQRAEARAPGAANAAFTLLQAMAEVLRTRGPLDLLLSLLEATLAPAIAAQADASLVGQALRDRATARHFAPETAEAKRADLTRALEIATQTHDVALELSCRSAFASLELIHGRPDAARPHAQAGLARARAEGDRAAIAKALGDLAGCDLAMGRLEEARACTQEALSIARALGNAPAVAINLARLAETVMQMGRMEEATAFVDEAVEVATKFDNERLLAMLSGIHATIAFEQEDLPGAERRFDGALAHAARAGADLLLPFYRACRGAVLADADDVVRATADIEAAAATVPRFKDEPVLAATVTVARGHLELALARADERAGDAKDALVHRAKAAKALDTLPTAHDYEDLRLMRRRFERALAKASGLATVAGTEAPDDALVVAEDGAWFKPPHGKRVALANRPNLKRLLLALTQHRIGAPGEALSLDAVFRGGWPGERADSRSAANRARVALARLRKIGLGDLLLTQGGYYLDPNVRVSIARS
jgi:predicted ATPase